jgi:molybdopterin converting factor small subunit
MVNIPVMMRTHTGGQKSVEAEGSCVLELIDSVDSRFPGFKEKICTADGALQRSVNIYVDGKDIKALNGLATPVNEGVSVHILMAIAGG